MTTLTSTTTLTLTKGDRILFNGTASITVDPGRGNNVYMQADSGDSFGPYTRDMQILVTVPLSGSVDYAIISPGANTDQAVTFDPFTQLITDEAARAAVAEAAGGGSLMRGPLRFVGLGDSNMFGWDNSPWSSIGESVVAASNGKIVHAKNAGVGGQTSAQIHGRISSDALPFKPDVVIAQIGTNDSANSAIVLQYHAANADAILGQTKDCIYVMCSTIPRTNAAYVSLAASIKALAESYNNPRIRYAATHEALIDSGTGFLKAEYSLGGGDQVHITDLGAAAAADAVLASLSDVLAGVSRVRSVYPSSSFTTQLFLNPYFDSAVANNVVSSGSGVSTAFVASDPGVTGGYSRSTFTAGGTGYVRLSGTSTFSNIAAYRGKRVFVSGKIRIGGSATSYNGLVDGGQVGNLFSGVSNVAGSFCTQTNAADSARGVWRFFHVEFDLATDARFSNGTVNFVTLASIVGGDVTIDIAELCFGAVGDAFFPASKRPTVASVSANHTCTGETLIKVDASGGARTITLTTAASAPSQVTVIKTDASANAVIVAPPSGTINGAANAQTTTQYGRIVAVSDGSNYFA